MNLLSSMSNVTEKKKWRVSVTKMGRLSFEEIEKWKEVFRSEDKESVAAVTLLHFEFVPFIQVTPVPSSFLNFALYLPPDSSLSFTSHLSSSISSPSPSSLLSVWVVANISASAKECLPSVAPRFAFRETEGHYDCDIIGFPYGMSQPIVGRPSASRSLANYFIHMHAFLERDGEQLDVIEGKERGREREKERLGEFVEVKEKERVRQEMGGLVGVFNNLSWLLMDLTTTKRKSVLPMHACVCERIAKMVKGV